MKALSVYPIWAALIASGKKTIELRTWPTAYRGPLLICATKRPNPDNLPAGVAVCTVELIDCRPMRPEDEAGSGVTYNPKFFAWCLRAAQPVAPIPVIGRQKLFTVRTRCLPTIPDHQHSTRPLLSGESAVRRHRMRTADQVSFDS